MLKQKQIYVIDGYNVLRSGHIYTELAGKSPNFLDWGTNEWNAAREALLNDVLKIVDKQTEAIIVYDGANYKGIYAQKTQSFKNLQVVFSDTMQSADERILEIVKKLKSKGMQVTVVTSDKEIQNVTFSKNVYRMSAREFAIFINENNQDQAVQLAQTTNGAVLENNVKTTELKSSLEKMVDQDTYQKLKNLRNQL